MRKQEWNVNLSSQQCYTIAHQYLHYFLHPSGEWPFGFGAFGRGTEPRGQGKGPDEAADWLRGGRGSTLLYSTWCLEGEREPSRLSFSNATSLIFSKGVILCVCVWVCVCEWVCVCVWVSVSMFGIEELRNWGIEKLRNWGMCAVLCCAVLGISVGIFLSFSQVYTLRHALSFF